MRFSHLLTVSLFAIIGLGGCGGSGWNAQSPAGVSPAPSIVDASPSLQVLATIERFRQLDPAIDGFLKNAYGFAVFPAVGSRSGSQGAYGEGEVYEQNELVGKAILTHGEVGEPEYSELIFFQDRRPLDEFRNGSFQFSSRASHEASSHDSYDQGVAVFAITKRGFQNGPAVTEQKFDFEPVEDGGRLPLSAAWLDSSSVL